MEVYAFVFIGGFFLGALLGLMAANSAYHNGITDGYGFAKEPGCPGYRMAGEYLSRIMSHRWPELEYCCHKHSPAWPGMFLCKKCGNKRCPKAGDCSMRCTNSNDPGQIGTPEELPPGDGGPRNGGVIPFGGMF